MHHLVAQILQLKREGKSIAAAVAHLESQGVERSVLRQCLEEIAISEYQLDRRPTVHHKQPVVTAIVAVFVLAVLATPFAGSFFHNDEYALVTPSAREIVSTPEVLGSAVDELPDVVAETATAAATTASHSSALAALTSPKTAQATYKLAVFGDSMVDTMGEHLDYLSAALKTIYPETEFDLYNYGVGSENISMGLQRFDAALNYKTRNFPPLTELKPDIIIIVSFAYNPFTPHDRNLHWLQYAALIDKAQATGAKVYLLAEIAPLKAGFGVGPNGVNWPESVAGEQSNHIKDQLANVVGLSAQKAVPLINAAAASDGGTGWGTKMYVNASDGIHPSAEGQALMAKLIAQQLELQ